MAVVGANGYVGRALTTALTAAPDIDLTKVTRENYAEAQPRSFDIVINAAMPSGRFWARNNPTKDFEETVRKTADLVYCWRFGKLVQVSTVSARCQIDTVYGRHKAAAETLCAFGENLVVRLGPMYSPDLGKGVLIDILEGRTVFVDGSSRYCFAPLEFVARWIAQNLTRSGCVEVGGRNAVRLSDVARTLGTAARFEGGVDHQEIESPEPSFPEARDVCGFLDTMRRRRAASLAPFTVNRESV